MRLKNDSIQLSSDLKFTRKNLNKNGQENNPIDTQNTKQEKTEIKNELDNFEKLFKNIIIYSKEKNTLAVYIKDTFWIKSLKEYDIPDFENINN